MAGFSEPLTVPVCWPDEVCVVPIWSGSNIEMAVFSFGSTVPLSSASIEKKEPPMSVTFNAVPRVQLPVVGSMLPARQPVTTGAPASNDSEALEVRAACALIATPPIAIDITVTNIFFRCMRNVMWGLRNQLLVFASLIIFVLVYFRFTPTGDISPHANLPLRVVSRQLEKSNLESAPSSVVGQNRKYRKT